MAGLDAALLLIELIEAQVAKAKERGEWTPEQIVAFDQRKAAVFNKPEWKRLRTK